MVCHSYQGRNDKGQQNLKMSACFVRDGIRYMGRYLTRFIAPRQSQCTSAWQEEIGIVSHTLCRMRFMANSPNSCPQYALEDGPLHAMTLLYRPDLTVHSKINAAAHVFGARCHMYDPSVAACRVLFCSTVAIQVCGPINCVCPHIHSLPHDARIVQKSNVSSAGATKGGDKFSIRKDVAVASRT